jgi:DNA-binding response OmpR family regulator
MSDPHILLIEDNPETAKTIKLYMEHNQFRCDIESSGAKGVTAFFRKHYDLVILDRMLPDLNGVAVCERIRKQSGVPIIMLTAKVTDDDLIDGLQAGADEYVKKPYSNKELVARVKSHLRRSARGADESFSSVARVGPYVLNVETCAILSNETQLPLTKTEYLIFEKLLKSPGQVFSRDQLFLAAFDASHESVDRTVDVHLHNLRGKISKSGLKDHGIKSVYGIGYKLDVA